MSRGTVRWRRNRNNRLSTIGVGRWTGREYSIVQVGAEWHAGGELVPGDPQAPRPLGPPQSTLRAARRMVEQQEFHDAGCPETAAA